MATAVVEQPKIEKEPTPSSSLMERRRRITVEEYHRMLDSGFLGPEPKVELLEGVIVEKMSENPPHNLARDLLQHLLHRLLVPGYFHSMATSMAIEDRDGEPEPDLMVLRGEIRDYAGRRRTPGDAALLTEVSDTSYDYDRYAKWVTYAAARVPVCWILDLNRRQLEVHTEPTGEGAAATYARIQVFGPDDEVPLILDGREVGRFFVREILP
jgi:Uma2 family endonuclease